MLSIGDKIKYCRTELSKYMEQALKAKEGTPDYATSWDIVEECSNLLNDHASFAGSIFSSRIPAFVQIDFFLALGESTYKNLFCRSRILSTRVVWILQKKHDHSEGLNI